MSLDVDGKEQAESIKEKIIPALMWERYWYLSNRKEEGSITGTERGKFNNRNSKR